MHTLYCFVLSEMEWPSCACVDMEQLEDGQRHCFSIQGEAYVSSFPHTEYGEQTGKSDSEF